MLKYRIEDRSTFEDVLLLPKYSMVILDEVSLKNKIPQTLECNIPVLCAEMDTVINHQTGICMSQEGEIVIIHKNMNVEEHTSKSKWSSNQRAA